MHTDRGTVQQRGLCGCESCEFWERRQCYENDPNAEWTECADCCRMFSEEPHDYYIPRLVHRGLFYGRTQNDCGYSQIEKALADTWEKECSAYRHSDLNFTIHDHAGDLLRELLTKKNGYQIEAQIEVTQDIATAVADIVQWMGTNCGISFLMKCFQKAGYSLSYHKIEKR